MGTRRCGLGLERIGHTKLSLSGWEQLADEQITASSEYSATYKAANGRIDQPSGYAWTPDINDKTPWIQVDFKESKKISGIKTQGRSNADWWVTQYSILYGNAVDSMKYITKGGQKVIFEGDQGRTD